MKKRHLQYTLEYMGIEEQRLWLKVNNEMCLGYRDVEM